MLLSGNRVGNLVIGGSCASVVVLREIKIVDGRNTWYFERAGVGKMFFWSLCGKRQIIHHHHSIHLESDWVYVFLSTAAPL